MADTVSDDDQPITVEWLESLGLKCSYEFTHYWVHDVEHYGSNRVQFIKNCNSDDPRISWSLTIFAAEGWHMQGFIQRRGTAKKLLECVGFSFNRRDETC